MSESQKSFFNSLYSVVSPANILGSPIRADSSLSNLEYLASLSKPLDTAYFENPLRGDDGDTKEDPESS